MEKTVEEIRAAYDSLKPLMNERLRRLWAASEARAIGRGGISKVVLATGLSRTTVRSGLEELKTTLSLPAGKIRHAGGGRKRLTHVDPEISRILETLIEPSTRGDPQSPLRWTCKSTQKLAQELSARGHLISDRTVALLLHQSGYSLHSNRKVLEGTVHPDRNAQFEHIIRQVKRMQRKGQPVISVDTKKKELVGRFSNGGREWQPVGRPEPVTVHDFVDEEMEKIRIKKHRFHGEWNYTIAPEKAFK